LLLGVFAAEHFSSKVFAFDVASPLRGGVRERVR
jgi:hypothetical protein